MIQMVVVSIFRWLLNWCWEEKNENMHIWSRYSLFENTDLELSTKTEPNIQNWMYFM